MEKLSLFQKSGIPKCFESILTLLYPPLCIHCKNVLKDSSKPLCVSCVESIELIDPEERCCYCFSPIESSDMRLCAPCRSRYPAYKRIASVFDYTGPPATLIKQMKYQDKPWLVEGIAGYLHYQLLNLDWPKPDFIVPVPICWAHWIERGYNQSALLAQYLAELMGKPMLDCIKKRNYEFSQAGKSKRQRKDLSSDCFYITDKIMINDKIILLIDDVITTGTTVELCSEALMVGHPAAIYVLTVCKSPL